MRIGEMIKVKTIRQTTGACPAQWEGEGMDGEDIYIRYRWGMFRIYINDEMIFQLSYGNEYDGMIDQEQMIEFAKDHLDFSDCDLQSYETQDKDS